MGRLNNLRRHINEGGLLYAFLRTVYFIGMKIISRLEKYIIRIEKRKYLVGPSTFSARYNTREENRRMWNNYDWAQCGEEWTQNAKTLKGLDPNIWKTSLINNMMLKYIRGNPVVIEIGPGGGRWTEVLQPICHRLLVADISEKCLSICKERFKAYSNIEYYLIEDGLLGFVPDDSVDYIWSYDVFVHINPVDTERYMIEFNRILKPGGYAIIHHSDVYSSEEDAKSGFRSSMDGKLFAHLVEKHGMSLVEQNNSLPHKLGDLISVFRKAFQ